jgi:hypothetical protein
VSESVAEVGRSIAVARTFEGGGGIINHPIDDLSAVVLELAAEHLCSEWAVEIDGFLQACGY